MSKIKVFIIDDSIMVRTLLSNVINANDEMEIVGVANDPVIAQKKLNHTAVDVILLDVEMPKMNGLDYLKQLMATTPKAVIVCSSLVQDRNSPTAVQALALGAVDVIGKEDYKIKEFVSSSSNKLTLAIQKASKAQIAQPTKVAPKTMPTNRAFGQSFSNSTIIAIGSSTGGIAIIEQILKGLPAQTPPILIVQHMKAQFIGSMASRMDSICKIKVKEAVDNEQIQPNTAYISPGDFHMKIKRDGNKFAISLSNEEKVSHHKPSVDVLFNSFSKVVDGSNIKAFILTGMGYDGATGISAIHKIGGKTYAQDEKSCTVYGMPKEAVKLGAIDKSLTPAEMSGYIAR